MTTKENTITISFSDTDDESVQAAYWQIEEGWVTFKSEDHKAVAAYPAGRVKNIMLNHVNQGLARKEAVDEMTAVVEDAMSYHAQVKDPDDDISLARSIAGLLVHRGYHPFANISKRS